MNTALVGAFDAKAFNGTELLESWFGWQEQDYQFLNS